MEERLTEKFLDRVSPEPNTGCWLWDGGRNYKGYGLFYIGRGVWRRAHRFAYRLFKGEIPKGLELDHLCRVRHCVNPDHLEAVTGAENHHRSRGLIARPKPKYCIRGHQRWSVRPDGALRCMECARLDALEAYHRGRRS